uniref:Retrovirus-related Pol polyprotein from transposon TNT 1-94 n=1 Tax=Tanacetum cinerariifolium TaxID=118510 RepID=A0A6L2JMW2_TANCI|nr:retrovirus-related Pol polyprotein from transposon TNT 1-94 [Tanacetum cinerariifolium]
MTIETHNWSSSAHQELHKIIRDEIFPIVNQVDARLQNFEIQFLKEAAKFARDFKSLANEADTSLAKHKALELEIKRLLKAVVSQDIITIVQKESVVDTSDLQTKLERTKERFENCIIKKENEYAKLWNNWYKKCDECKYDKISYDKAYKDMQQKIERLQAQLGDLKGKSKDTSCVTDTQNQLSQKLKNENLELEFQVLNYARENAHLKATYKNIFESISVSRTQTKTIIYSLQNELQSTIYKNAKLRTQLFKKVSDQKDNKHDMSENTKFVKQPIMENLPKVGETNALSKPVTSNSVSTPQESKGVNNDKVIAPGMFRINPDKTSREEKNVPNTVRASNKKKPITVSQPPVITKKYVNSDVNGLSSTGVDNTKTRRPLPKSNTKNDRVIQICLWCVDSGCSKHMTGNLKLLINFVWKFMGTVRFGNDLVAAILGFEVAFRRNACFVRNLEGVDLLKGDRSTNLYTINLYEMAFASLICLMARASSTKSWLWHQLLSYLNFDTINDLARNDLVSGLPKFKYHKEHLCPSCEQGKSKRASHPPKPVLNSRQRLPLLHMDLCRPMRIASINGKWYVLVIVDDYSRYTWAHFLRSKDEAPDVIKTFLKRITVLLQSPVIIIRTDNGTEFKNQVLKEYFDSVGISHQMYSVRTPQQNGVVERRNRTLVEATRTMLIFSRAPLFLWAEAIATACFTQNRSIIHRRFNKTPYELINGRKPDISFLHVFGALCYPKNDREDIGKLGAKGDIGFFIGYSADSCVYRIYKRMAKKIMVTMNVSFDELSTMAFEQHSSKPELQTTARTVLPAQEPQVRQTSTTSTTIADSVPTPTNSSSHATNIPITSQDVDEINSNAMVDRNTFVNPFANSSTSAVESSSSQNNHFFKGTIDPTLFIRRFHDDISVDSGFELTGFSDADYAGCKDTFKSTSGGAQLLGEKLVSWSSKKQDCTALSTAKAEYVSLSACCAQVLWMRTQLTDYGFHFNKILIYYDSKSAIAISCKPVQHSRTKHIAVCYHFIKEHVKKGTIKLYFVKTDYLLADIFTKALPADRFNYLVRRLGMHNLSPKEFERLEKSQ